MNKKILAQVIAGLFGAAPFLASISESAHAAGTDITTSPLANRRSSDIKPNLMLILDDSGSMMQDYMPDSAGNNDAYGPGYRNHLCNTIYYNPTPTNPSNSLSPYLVPRDDTGAALNSLSAATFSSAHDNGYWAYDQIGQSSGTPTRTDLRADQGWGAAYPLNPSGQAAYYWSYLGSNASSVTPTSGVCTLTSLGSGSYESATGVCSSNGTAPYIGTYTLVTAANPDDATCVGAGSTKLIWKKVVVSATSSPVTSYDERQRFANWYAYYRNRMQMSKSAIGRAFLPLVSKKKFRVGFVTIAPSQYDNANVQTGVYPYDASTTYNTKFLEIRNFDTTDLATNQPYRWFKILYAQRPNGQTPLREGLSRVGRYYAGKNDGPNEGMIADNTKDPVQYACQQNYAILTTDGYWDSPPASIGGFKLTYTDAMDNQDGNINETDSLGLGLAIGARPVYDGAITSTVTTTDANNEYQQPACTYYLRSDTQILGSTSQPLRSTSQVFGWDRLVSATTNQKFSSTVQQLATTDQKYSWTKQPLASTTQRFYSTRREVASTNQLVTYDRWVERSTRQLLQSTSQLRSSTRQIISTTNQRWSNTIAITSSTSQLRLSTWQLLRTTRQPRASTTQYFASTSQLFSSTLLQKLSTVQVKRCNGVGANCVVAATCDPGAEATTCTTITSGPTSVSSCVAGTNTSTWVTTSCATSTVSNTATASCTAGTNTSTWVTTSCATSTVSNAATASCTAGTNTSTWVTTTCSTSMVANTGVTACAVATDTSTWVTTTCSTSTLTTGVTACSASTNTSTWVTTTCSTSTTGNVAASACTAGTNTSTWVTTSCATTTSALTAVTACSASINSSTWVTTTCATSTVPTGVTACTAGTNTSTWITTTCATSTPAATGVTACTASTNTSTWITTSCSTSTTNSVAASACTAGTNTSTWVTTTCATSATGPSTVSSCTVGTNTSTWITTTCATSISGQTGVSTCTASTNTSTWVTTLCATLASSFATSVCVAAAASAGNSWVATTCATSTAGPTATAACTAGTNTSTWVTTTCSTSITTNVPAASCAAGTNTGTWVTTTCSTSTSTAAAISSCTAATNTSTWVTTVCSTSTVTSGIASCAAGTNTTTWVTTTCSTSTTSNVTTASCAAGTNTSTWVTTTCATSTATNGVAACSAGTNTSTWVTTTCATSVATATATSACSPATNSTTWVTSLCSTTTTGPTGVSTCSPSTNTTTWVTTTCSTSVTTDVPVASCAAGTNTSTWVTTTCDTTSSPSNTTSVVVQSCSAVSATSTNSYVSTACVSQAGAKNQYRTQTQSLINRYSDTTVVGSTSNAWTAFTSWTDMSLCLAPASLPALPANGQPGPSDPATPPYTSFDGACTGWPCAHQDMTSSGGSSNSLADVAQYYYKTDLRPANATGQNGLDVSANIVPTSATDTTEGDMATWQHMTTFTMGLGVSGNIAYNADYKNKPVGTFTSGVPNEPFQKIRCQNASNANLSDPNLCLNWPVPSAATPAAVDDLWHAAVNGRGQYFSAADPDTVYTGLQTTLQAISAQTGAGTGATTSTQDPVAGNDLTFNASFRTVDWTGDIQTKQMYTGTNLALEGTTINAVVWSAQSQLDGQVGAACDNRNIYLPRKGATNNMVGFTWNTYACDNSGLPTGTVKSDLNATEMDYLASASASSYATPFPMIAWSQYLDMTDGTNGLDQRVEAQGSKLLNFLRGQRGGEGFISGNATKLFRTRAHVLGDIVTSQPRYVAAPAGSFIDMGYAGYKAINAVATRPKMLYVGANDGMMHAFRVGADAYDDQGGTEAWALVPTAVLPNLYRLADTGYAEAHTYYVDSTPKSADVYDKYKTDCDGTTDLNVAKTCWKTVLVGGLGAGGRGYYAMDVTDPTSPKVLWEFNWSDTCYDSADSTTHYSDCHIGLTFGEPLITKIYDGVSEGRWVALVTSGVNNVNTPAKTGDGVGYLYVLDVMTGKIIKKISTGAGDATTPSGFSKINAYVENYVQNNLSLRVYGGDMLGNVWRITLPQLANLNYDVVRVAKVLDPSGNPQPITTTPQMKNIGNTNIPMVYVATGRYLGESDLKNTQTQTVYGIPDNLNYVSTTQAYIDRGNTVLPATGYTLRQTLNQVVLSALSPSVTTTRVAADPVCVATTIDPLQSCSGWYVDLPDAGERVSVDMRLVLGSLVVPSNVTNLSACDIGGNSWFNVFDASTGGEVANNPYHAGTYMSGAVTVGMSIIRGQSGRILSIITKSTGEQEVKEVKVQQDNPIGKHTSWRDLSN